MKDKDSNLLEEAYKSVRQRREEEAAMDKWADDVMRGWNEPEPDNPGIYEIYRYSDVNRGWGHSGTIVYIKHAKSTEDAKRQYAEYRGRPWSHDPDGITYGIQKIDKIPTPPPII
jgi:hypothetical protein